MTTSKSKNPISPLAQSALSLDEDFSELEKVASELERLELDSDQGLDRARRLLSKFGECGERIGDRVQALARALEDAKTRAEKSAQKVAERAAAVQERQVKAQGLMERFQALGEMVRKVNGAVAQLRKPASGTLTDEERELLRKHLPEIGSQLDQLTDEAGKLRDDAHAANMKGLERDAHSLTQTLQSARHRLGNLAS